MAMPPTVVVDQPQQQTRPNSQVASCSCWGRSVTCFRAPPSSVLGILCGANMPAAEDDEGWGCCGCVCTPLTVRYTAVVTQPTPGLSTSAEPDLGGPSEPSSEAGFLLSQARGGPASEPSPSSHPQSPPVQEKKDSFTQTELLSGRLETILLKSMPIFVTQAQLSEALRLQQASQEAAQSTHHPHNDHHPHCHPHSHLDLPPEVLISLAETVIQVTLGGRPVLVSSTTIEGRMHPALQPLDTDVARVASLFQSLRHGPLQHARVEFPSVSGGHGPSENSSDDEQQQRD